MNPIVNFVSKKLGASLFSIEILSIVFHQMLDGFDFVCVVRPVEFSLLLYLHSEVYHRSALKEFVCLFVRKLGRDGAEVTVRGMKCQQPYRATAHTGSQSTVGK